MTAAVSRAPICETRIGKPDDLAFVVDTWTKYALRTAARSVRLGDLTRHVRKLLGVADVPLHDLPPHLPRLLVAHVPGEPDAILGWAAVEAGRPGCVHYVYVRRDARLQGVARALVGSTDVALEYSHAAPKGIAVPKAWTLNIARAGT